MELHEEAPALFGAGLFVHVSIEITQLTGDETTTLTVSHQFFYLQYTVQNSDIQYHLYGQKSDYKDGTRGVFTGLIKVTCKFINKRLKHQPTQNYIYK